MTPGKQVELGFRTYFNAIGFIFSNGLWWAFIVPVILNVLLFIGGYHLISSVTHNIQEWILGIVGVKDSEFFLSGVLTGFLSGVIWILLKVLFFFLFAYWGGYITLALLSPLFAYLSQKTDEIITGNKYRFNGDQWMRDMWRGILIVLRNFFIQTGWMIVLFLIGLIPVVGWFGAIVLFLISSYFYGFAFIDYTSERRKMKINESVQFVRLYKWLAISNGAIFSLFLLLPFCGVLFSGFAAIVAVVAATLAANEISAVQK